jgi:ATP-dependent helicase IRC3
MSLFDSPTAIAKITLRPYQEEALSAVREARKRGVRRGLLVLPTGTGKTSTFVALCQSEPEKSLIIAHRDELLEQAAARVETQAGLPVTIEGGGRKADLSARVMVAGVQTVGRTSNQVVERFGPRLLVIDEAHHAPADTYQQVIAKAGGYDPFSETFVLGVTATDHRLDNKPLHGGDKPIFEEVIYRYSLRQAMRDSWLCDIRGFRVDTDVDLSKVKTTAGDYNQGQLAKAVNTPERNAAAVKAWRDLAEGRLTIVFCADVQHAKDVAEAFRDIGVTAEAVWGDMGMEQRRAAMERFRTGQTQVLTNVEIATEGFDVPAIACVLMLRPTKSWALYTQCIGRGLRLFDGKEDCLVIDMADNSGRHQLGKTPAVAGLLGLPPQVNLKGKSLAGAADAWDGLSGAAQARLWTTADVIDDLEIQAQAIDLFASLATPPEIEEAGGTMSWLASGEDRYSLHLQGVQVAIQGDELGRYRILLIAQSVKTHPQPFENLQAAVREAERVVHLRYPASVPLVTGRAKWRSDPPTEKQVAFLRRLGVEEEIIAGLDSKGQAVSLINIKLADKKGAKVG